MKKETLDETRESRLLYPEPPRIVEASRLKAVHVISFQQVFLERIGCFSVNSNWIEVYQDPPLETVKTCSSLARSLGLKVFAVRNGGECLGDKHLHSQLPRLNSSNRCLGGRGGQNASDVYRFTSKKTLSLNNQYPSIYLSDLVYLTSS